MTTYLIYMASPALLSLFFELLPNKSITSNIKSKKIYLILCGLCMTLMIGLRAPTNGSGDTLFYCKLWETFSNMSLDSFVKFSRTADMELGYQISTWVLSQFFPDGQWLLLLSALFMSVCVCVFVYENCKNPVLALSVFNCLGLFNFMVQGLRQALAMCICLFAIKACQKRKLIKFILLVIVASLFHASAIVFFPVYFIGFKKFNVKNVILFGMGIVILIAFLPSWFELVNTAMNDSYMLDNGSDQGGIVAILIYVAILLFALLFQGRDDEKYPLFVCMATLGMVCMILRLTTNGIIERVSLFFSFSQMVLVSNCAHKAYGSNRNSKVILNILIVALCLGVAFYKASYSNLVPYLFYWQI